MIFTGTAAILEKLDVLNNAMKTKSCDFLHEKQEKFDKDYMDFKEYIAQTRVS